MSKIKIVTDSLTDIPKEIKDTYNITIVPLTIIFANEEFRDGVDLNGKEFYEKLAKSKDLPKTSQIPPYIFKEEFLQWIEKGYEVLCINGSSKASGTHQSALIAKEELGQEKIHCFDTMGLSFGGGLLVLEAARMVEAGATAKDIITKLEKLRDRLDHIFTVDTLEYLRKGGRLNPMKAVVGGILNVKPILTVREGIVEPLDKVRGSKKVIGKMVELVKESNSDFSDKTIGLGHANCLDTVMQLKEKIEKELNPKEIIIAEVGCTIGTHCGQGTLGIFYFK